MDNVRIDTFAGLRIRGLRKPIRSSHATALFVYLAVSGQRPVRREFLADLLWGGTRVRRARHSLTQAVYSLRASLPPGTMVCTAADVGINPKTIRVDYLEFVEAVEHTDFARATELYKGKFLEQFKFISDAFEDWRLDIDAAAHSRAVAAFNSLLSEALDSEDYGRSAALAKAALILTPFEPRLIRTRVESLAATGEVARALRELELARQALRLEVGQVPQELSEDFSHRLAGLAAEPRPSTGPVHVRMVGRAAELMRIREQWRGPASGVSVVAISGEAGIGKSRLLEHVVRRSVLDGAHAFLCRCSEAESRLPYGTVANLIKSGFRPSHVRHMHETWPPILATIAPELLPQVAPAHGCSQRALWESIAHYFIAASDGKPLILAVDDHQWSDEISRDVIQYVTKRLSNQRVLVIIAHRGSLVAPVFEDDRGSVLKIDVQPLDESSVEELINAAADQYALQLGPETRNLVIQRGGGNPFFLLEDVRQVAALLVSEVDRPATLQPWSDIAHRLENRLRDLDSNSVKVLDVVAVVGRPCSLQLVARVTGLSPVEVANAAEALIGCGIMRDTGDVCFAHDLLLEAQRRRIRAADRRLWHANIAEVLARTPNVRSGEVAAHYEAAGETANAYRFAILARDEALALHAHAEADAQFRRMIRCSTGAAMLSAEAEYVKWLVKSSRLTDIVPFAEALRPFFSSTRDHEGLLALSVAGFEQLERSGAGTPEHFKEEALRIVEHAKHYAPPLVPAVLWQVADTLRRAGEFPLIAELASYVRSQSDSVDTALAAEMLPIAALLTTVSNGYARALPIAERAVAHADAIGDAILLAKALYARGTVNVYAGRIAAAEADYDKVATLASPIGPQALLERLRSNISVVLLEQGKLEEAEQQALNTLMNASAARRGYAYGNLCLIALRRADAASVRRYARALEEWNLTARHAWVPVHAESLNGLADLLAGQIDRAAERAAFVRKSLHTDLGTLDLSDAYLLLARVDEHTGYVDRAVGLLRIGARLISCFDRLAGARLHLERARLYAAADDTRRARRIASVIRAFAEANGAVALGDEARAFLA